MKAMIVVATAILLTGCGATAVVADKVVSAQDAYCDLDAASRAAVKRQYRAALARRLDGGVGYGMSIDCPGDA